MKFSVDNKLPSAVARWMSAGGVDAVPILDRGQGQKDDVSLWNEALAEGRIVVSKEVDFFNLATRPDDQGRLLWLRVGNCRKQHLLELLAKAWPSIAEAFASGRRIVELRLLQ